MLNYVAGTGLHWKVRLLEDKRMVAVNSCGTQVQFLLRGYLNTRSIQPMRCQPVQLGSTFFTDH